MFYTNSSIKEKIFARLETEIKNAIDDKKYFIRRTMREHLKKKLKIEMLVTILLTIKFYMS